MDSTQSTDDGGGVGWRKLTNTTNMYTGVTTREITVYPDAVPSVAVFKCVITDTDSASDTHNGTFYDTVTFTDLSDPIQCTIVSRAGSEIDTTAPYSYTYKWYKYDKNATLVSGWGGSTDYKTGKTVTVTAVQDVDVKATFRVEVE